MVVAIPPRNRSWEHVGDDENSDPARSRVLLAQKARSLSLIKNPPVARPGSMSVIGILRQPSAEMTAMSSAFIDLILVRT